LAARMAVTRATPADVLEVRIWAAMATLAVAQAVDQVPMARITKMVRDTRAAGRVVREDSDPVVRTATTMAAVIGTRDDSQTHLARSLEHIAIPSSKSF